MSLPLDHMLGTWLKSHFENCFYKYAKVLNCPLSAIVDILMKLYVVFYVRFGFHQWALRF